MESERVEMKSLEELRFPHEATKRAGPSFAEHVNPFHIHRGKLDSGQRQGLAFLDVSQRLVDDEIHQLPAVRFNQRVGYRESGVGLSLGGKREAEFVEGGSEMCIEGLGERMGWESDFGGKSSGHGRH